MENFNSEYAQMYESSSGIFNQYQEPVIDFNQIGQTQDFPELEDITNLTKFDENLTNFSVIDAIETPINEEEEEPNESFETTLSASEFDDDLDFEINVEDLEHIIEDTINEFPNLLDEITDDDLNAVKMLTQQIVPQFQLPVINQIEVIKPEIHYQELRHQEPVIIPIMNDKMEVIREEFQCTICQKNFTALSSLTRHTKTQKHLRMLSHQQVDQVVPNLSFNSVPTQNLSYNQQLMMPTVNYVLYQPEVQFQTVQNPRASIIEQKRQNFTQKIQNSRNNMIDQNRMIAIKEESNNDNIIIIEDFNEPKVEEKVQILEDLVNSGFEGSFVNFDQPIQALEPKTTTQNATKSAIQNSMKILSKINTETALKSPEPILKTESSPKKQNLKQLTLMDMTFKKPAAIQQYIEDEVEVKEEFAAVTENLFDFDFDADDFLDSFNQEPELPKIDPEWPQINPEPELAQYIQEVPEKFYPEQEDEQPQFQFVISGDEIFTITQIEAPEQTKQSNLQKIMSKKRLERIQNDISTSYEAYKCNFCSKAFSTQSNLRRHEHLHGSKKLHQCRLCGKEFMQKEYLKKHMMTH